MERAFCIGVTTNNTFLGKVIKLFTGSLVNHTFQYEEDGVTIIDSWGGVGVRELKEEDFTGINNILAIYEIKPPEDNLWKLTEGMNEIKKEVGKGYDYLNVIGMGIVTILEKISIKINNFLFSKNRYQCAELSLKYINNVFKCKDIPMHPETIRPDTLMSYMERHTDMFTKIYQREDVLIDFTADDPVVLLKEI